MDFDGDLIDALRDNGRLSVSELSRRLNVPRRRVQEQLNSLLDNKEMRIVANVHPGLLGIRIFCDVLVWVSGPSAPVLEALNKFPEMAFITSVAGNCDIIVEVGASSREHLEEVLEKIRRIPGVQETASSQLLRIFKSRFDTGSDMSTAEFQAPDEHDATIIALLREDGRMPYRELSHRVGLSIGAVRARAARLLESGMLSITCELNEPGTTGRMQVGVSIRRSDQNEHLIETLCAMPSISFVASALGHFDLIMTLSGASLRGIYNTLEEIRQLPGVGSVTSWMHLEIARESYE